jgi:dienelactone hydrolase
MSRYLLLLTSVLVLAAFVVTPCHAQKEFDVLTDAEKVAPRKLLSAYLLAEAQKHFDARRAEVAAMKGPDDVRHRQWKLRQRMLAALGGFPEKTPLNAKVVGKEKRDGYSIEKVIYESRPNHHVTATLYLPASKGPHPACIMPIGHSNNGKAADYVQRGSILLARNGIACLAYDPIGQGERRQLLDEAGKSLIPSSTNEHTLIGVGALLVGQSTATYRIWDGIRSLDYLETRPEIDATRLGCTGCSGGGTLTSYLMALDDRIVCAAPSCYITSLERLFATIGPQDAEQNITGQVALGIEHADYLTMRAPRPTLLATATQDFFDIKGSWTSYREATQIYGLMGRSECVNLVEFNTKHGYPKPQREAIVRWMSRWLLNKDVAIVEPAFAIAKDADLQCTRSGQVLEDFKGKSAFHLNAEFEQKLAKARPAKIAPEDVRKLIGLPDKITAAKVRFVGKETHTAGKLRFRKYIFETESGILVPALHFLSNKAQAFGLVVYVHGAGKAADTGAKGPIEHQVEAGNEVLALDVRGMGETSPSAPTAKPGYFGFDFQAAYISLHLNRPLLGQRVYDVLSVMEYLHGEQTTFTKKSTVLWGIDSAGPIALHAGFFDSKCEGVVTNRSILSWAAVVQTPLSTNQLTNVVPGALRKYDLPDLAAAMAPRFVTVKNGVTPRLEPAPKNAMEEAYRGASQANAALAIVVD